MARGFSTPSSRELGHELRRRREAAKMSAADLMRGLGMEASKISRAESGLYPLSDVEVARYLSWLRVPPDEVEYVLRLKAIEAQSHGIWLRSTENGPMAPELRSLVYHETTATRSTSYEPLFVPGLLQTEDYATALIREATSSADEVERYVQARMDRQGVFNQQPRVQFTFFIHERALRFQVGDARVMTEQMWRLVLTPSSCVVRVVPITANAAALGNGSFRLFEYSKEHRPLVYVSSAGAGLFIDDTDCVGRFQKLLPRLDQVALPEGQSKELLAALASDDEGPRGEPDAYLEDKQFQRSARHH